jgi:hypothetical protein
MQMFPLPSGVGGCVGSAKEKENKTKKKSSWNNFSIEDNKEDGEQKPRVWYALATENSTSDDVSLREDQPLMVKSRDHCGKVQISIELLPKHIADLQPAGKGRKEPNEHPILPEPDRFKWNPLSPFGMLKGLVGPALFSKVKKIVIAISLCAVIGIILPLVFSEAILPLVFHIFSNMFNSCGAGMIQADVYYSSVCLRTQHDIDHDLPMDEACCPGEEFESLGIIPTECICHQHLEGLSPMQILDSRVARGRAPDIGGLRARQPGTICSKVVWTKESWHVDDSTDKTSGSHNRCWQKSDTHFSMGTFVKWSDQAGPCHRGSCPEAADSAADFLSWASENQDAVEPVPDTDNPYDAESWKPIDGEGPCLTIKFGTAWKLVNYLPDCDPPLSIMFNFNDGLVPDDCYPYDCGDTCIATPTPETTPLCPPRKSLSSWSTYFGIIERFVSFLIVRAAPDVPSSFPCIFCLSPLYTFYSAQHFHVILDCLPLYHYLNLLILSSSTKNCRVIPCCACVCCM